MRKVLLALGALAWLAARADAAPSLAELQAEFRAVSGARLVFDRGQLPAGGYHDVMPDLDAARQLAAARIALAEVRKYPPGYLGRIGLHAVGVFAACVSRTNDGFHHYDADLGGYLYFGIYNGKDGVAAAYYNDDQLPLTLHHEIFHHIDATRGGVTSWADYARSDDERFARAIAGQERYPALAIGPLDLAELRKRSHGWVLEGAVGDYAGKEPGEDQAETARYLMSALPDALLQAALRPQLGGSQRILHVLAAYQESLPGVAPDAAWLVDVALGRAAVFTRAATATQAEMRARIQSGGAFVVHGSEDAQGVNWTLRADVTGFAREAARLKGLASRASGAADALTRTELENLRLLSRYLGFIRSHWSVSPGTQAAFETARASMIAALPDSRGALMRALAAVPLERLAELLGDGVTQAANPTQAFVAVAAGLRLNAYLDKVDAVSDPAARAAIRRVQPATVRVGGGSGVNLAASGRILTAGHVAGKLGARLTALFPDGHAVSAVCTAYDAKLDLAILSVVSAEELPFAPVAAVAPASGTHVIVIGQPGTRTPEGEATGYQPFHVSEGQIRGFVEPILGEQSLGRVKHDAWTYWGHSGSPLFDARGRVVALHNSWDSTTAMRRAVPQQAIVKFLADAAVAYTAQR